MPRPSLDEIYNTSTLHPEPVGMPRPSLDEIYNTSTLHPKPVGAISDIVKGAKAGIRETVPAMLLTQEIPTKEERPTTFLGKAAELTTSFLDPTLLLGAGIGGFAARTVAKKGIQAAIRKKIAENLTQAAAEKLALREFAGTLPARMATSAGALGAWEGVKEPIVEKITTGKVSPIEAVKTAAKGAILGAAFPVGGAVTKGAAKAFGVGEKAAELARFGGEIGTIATMPAAVEENRLPTLEEIGLAVVPIVGIHAAGRMANKILNRQKITGEKTEEIINQIKTKAEEEGKPFERVFDEQIKDKESVYREKPKVKFEGEPAPQGKLKFEGEPVPPPSDLPPIQESIPPKRITPGSYDENMLINTITAKEAGELMKQGKPIAQHFKEGIETGIISKEEAAHILGNQAMIEVANTPREQRPEVVKNIKKVEVAAKKAIKEAEKDGMILEGIVGNPPKDLIGEARKAEKKEEFALTQEKAIAPSVPAPITPEMFPVERKTPETKLQPKSPQKEGFEMLENIRAIKAKEAQLKIPIKKTVKDLSLAEWIYRKGGIKDEGMTGEVNRLKSFNLKRKDGLSFDRLRENAVEEGFIAPDTSVSDFIDLIEQDATAKANKTAVGRVYARSTEPVLPEEPFVKVKDLDLKKGDKSTIDGEEYEVKDIDKDGNFIIEDGMKFVVGKNNILPQEFADNLKRASKETSISEQSYDGYKVGDYIQDKVTPKLKRVNRLLEQTEVEKEANEYPIEVIDTKGKKEIIFTSDIKRKVAAKKEITLGSGLGSLQDSYEALAFITKNKAREALPHLEKIGQSVYDKAMSFKDFTKKMKEALGEQWDKFKQFMLKIYQSVKKAYKKSKLGEEKGSFSNKPIQGKFTELTEPMKPTIPQEPVKTTKEKLSEPVLSSTPEPVKELLETAKGQLNDFYEKVKIFFDPFYQIGKYGEKSRELYEVMRGKERATQARIDKFGKKIHDKLMTFPDDVRRDIHRYHNGTITLIDLPEDARSYAASTKNESIRIGRMAVNAGILDKDTFEANKGTWIHFMYAKDIFGKYADFNASGKLDLGYTIGRIDPKIVKSKEGYQVVSKGGKPYTKDNLTFEEAQEKAAKIQEEVDYKRKEWGQIEDAAITIPVGWGKVLSDLAKIKRFNSIAEDPNITFQPARVEVAGKKMGIGDIRNELQTYKAIVERGEANPETITRYKQLNQALLIAEQAANQAIKDFKEMPTGKKWGALSGQLVKNAVYDDLMPLYNISKDNYGKLFKTFIEVGEKGMTAFKVAHVPLNLPTVVRNGTSMILQMVLRPNGKVVNVIPYTIKSIQEHISKGRIYKMAERDGLFTGNWTTGELNEILDVWKKAQGENGGIASILKAVSNLAKYYGKIDDIGKLAIYMEEIGNGSTRAKAFAEASKWGMDYSVASKSVKMARRFIVPFGTYQYKIAPLLLESLQKKPHVVLALVAIAPYLAQEAVKDMADISDDEWKRLKNQLPDYIKKSGSYQILPFKSKEGNWQWVNLEYFFPWGNWMSVFRDMKQGDIGEFVNDFGIGNPFLDLLSAMKSATSDRPPQDPFTGRDIYSPLDSPAEQWAKLAEFLYNKWTPSMLSVDIGGTGKGAAQMTLNIGAKDKWGRTITPAQAAGRWLGFNIVAVSPLQTMAIKKAKLAELEAEKYRQFKKGNLTYSQIQAINQRYIKEKRKILGIAP